MGEFLAVILIGSMFWTIIFVLWMAAKGAKKAVTENPQAALTAIKVAAAMLRK